MLFKYTCVIADNYKQLWRRYPCNFAFLCFFLGSIPATVIIKKRKNNHSFHGMAELIFRPSMETRTQPSKAAGLKTVIEIVKL